MQPRAKRQRRGLVEGDVRERVVRRVVGMGVRREERSMNAMVFFVVS